MRLTNFLSKRSHWAPQNENKVPFKMQMPLALKNKVTSKGSNSKERGCLYEISLVLACMQQNNYQETLCSKEVTNFHQCWTNYLSNRQTAKEHARKGILTPNAKNLKYNQVNQLLRQYPHV